MDCEIEAGPSILDLLQNHYTDLEAKQEVRIEQLTKEMEEIKSRSTVASSGLTSLEKAASSAVPQRGKLSQIISNFVNGLKRH